METSEEFDVAQGESVEAIDDGGQGMSFRIRFGDKIADLSGTNDDNLAYWSFVQVLGPATKADFDRVKADLARSKFVVATGDTPLSDRAPGLKGRPIILSVEHKPRVKNGISTKVISGDCTTGMDLRFRSPEFGFLELRYRDPIVCNTWTLSDEPITGTVLGVVTGDVTKDDVDYLARIDVVGFQSGDHQWVSRAEKCSTHADEALLALNHARASLASEGIQRVLVLAASARNRDHARCAKSKEERKLESFISRLIYSYQHVVAVAAGPIEGMCGRWKRAREEALKDIQALPRLAASIPSRSVPRELIAWMASVVASSQSCRAEADE